MAAYEKTKESAQNAGYDYPGYNPMDYIDTDDPSPRGAGKNHKASYKQQGTNDRANDFGLSVRLLHFSPFLPQKEAELHEVRLSF